jgi:hypothetical protein
VAYYANNQLICYLSKTFSLSALVLIRCYDRKERKVTTPEPSQLKREPIRFVSMLRPFNRDAGIAGVSAPLDTSSVAVKKESPSVEFFVDCFRKIKRFFTEPNPPEPLFA